MTDPITQVGANGKAASHASAAAIDFTKPRVFFVIGDRWSVVVGIGNIG